MCIVKIFLYLLGYELSLSIISSDYLSSIPIGALLITSVNPHHMSAKYIVTLF